MESAARFFLHGQRISGQKLQALTSGDIKNIEVFNEVIGGAGDDQKPDNVITIGVKDQDGMTTSFKIKKDTKFQRVFEAYAQRIGVNVETLTFRIDGQRITKENTPKMLEMQDGDSIEVMSAQTGGEL